MFPERVQDYWKEGAANRAARWPSQPSREPGPRVGGGYLERTQAVECWSRLLLRSVKSRAMRSPTPPSADALEWPLHTDLLPRGLGRASLLCGCHVHLHLSNAVTSSSLLLITFTTSSNPRFYFCSTTLPHPATVLSDGRYCKRAAMNWGNNRRGQRRRAA